MAQGRPSYAATLQLLRSVFAIQRVARLAASASRVRSTRNLEETFNRLHGIHRVLIVNSLFLVAAPPTFSEGGLHRFPCAQREEPRSPSTECRSNLCRGQTGSGLSPTNPTTASSHPLGAVFFLPLRQFFAPWHSMDGFVIPRSACGARCRTQMGDGGLAQRAGTR